MIETLNEQLNIQPLVERIVDKLANAILTGEIPLGSKLREQSLALSLGVSRGPLREAIRRLEGRHLVKRVPNHGPRVISLDASDIREIFMLREALEGIACRAATELMSDAELRDLQQLVSLQFHNRELNKHTFDGDLDFHARIIAGAGNARLRTIVQEELYYLLKIYRRASEVTPDRDLKALEEHRDIAQAMVERDASLAESLMRRHIRKSRDNLIRYASIAEALDNTSSVD
jgi:DNA-binding GntR family transcriptional regulator